MSRKRLQRLPIHQAHTHLYVLDSLPVDCVAISCRILFPKRSAIYEIRSLSGQELEWMDNLEIDTGASGEAQHKLPRWYTSTTLKRFTNVMINIDCRVGIQVQCLGDLPS